MHSFSYTFDCLTLETQTETPRYNYKKTDWKKFQTLLEQNCDIKIYNNVNLTDRHIDSFIDEIEKHIQIALQEFVPTLKGKDSCEPYVNYKIKKLQRDKSYILSKLNNLTYSYSCDKREGIEFLKYLLYKIKSQLKQEFANSINQFWTNKIKNISKKDSASMFSHINQIFRPKEQNSLYHHTLVRFLTFPNEKCEKRIRVVSSKDTPTPSFPR